MLFTGPEPVRTFEKHLVKRSASAAFQGTFPNNRKAPPGLCQRRLRTRINLPVSRDLGPPEFSPGRGQFEEVAIMPVPEAAMRENHCAITWQDKIWRSRQRPVMQPEAKSAPVQSLAQ